ncbi:MAG: hypothetical protein AAFR93_01310 [Pseudomonadota bacterium]
MKPRPVPAPNPRPDAAYPNEDPFFGLGDLLSDAADAVEAGVATGLDGLGEAVGIADTRHRPDKTHKQDKADE